MRTLPFDIGFRVVGHRAATRRAVQLSVAFAAYAGCDPQAKVDREAYLSAFLFDGAFADYLKQNRSERAYNGPRGASWLWWDMGTGPAPLERPFGTPDGLPAISSTGTGNSTTTTCSSS